MKSARNDESPMLPHELLLSTAIGLLYGLGVVLLILITLAVILDQSTVTELISVLTGTDPAQIDALL